MPLWDDFSPLEAFDYFMAIHLDYCMNIIGAVYNRIKLDCFNSGMKKKIVIEKGEEDYEIISKKIKPDTNYLTGKPYS
jgi:small nuclear ribonucleoprotein (snRNP)-like protein